MTTRLVNFAAMPAAGVYTARRVSAERFGDLIAAAARRRDLKCYVGYETSLDVCEVLAGVELPLVKERCEEIADGDVILLMTLRDAGRFSRHKGRAFSQRRDVIPPSPRASDFDFFEITYSAK